VDEQLIQRERDRAHQLDPFDSRRVEALGFLDNADRARRHCYAMLDAARFALARPETDDERGEIQIGGEV
jgi:hypothetical protein